MKHHILAARLCILTFVIWHSSFVIPAHAGPRTSASYSIVTDTADAGGQRTASASYTNDGSTGAVAGLSTVAAPAETAKHGFIGQLYDVAGLVVNSAAPSVNEAATLQLAAWQFLDDESYLSVAANAVTWNVVSGPLTGISAGGLATAGVVAQATPASVQAIHGGFTGSLNFTVLDTIADNFGTYASDGIGDDWQMQYFGENNPLAAPQLDPDFDGHNNLFEFSAGINPTSAASRFLLTNARPAGQPGQMNIVIHPRFTDRNYVVKSSPTLGLGAVWTPLTGFTISDNGLTRTVTDTSATGTAKFYVIEITKP